MEKYARADCKNPPRAGVCSLEVVDAKQNIVSIQEEEIPEWTKQEFLEKTSYSDIHTLIFYYMPEVDLIVLNRSHMAYELYECLIPVYLASSEEDRRLIRQEIPKESIGTSPELLDQIYERRINARHQMRDSGDLR